MLRSVIIDMLHRISNFFGLKTVKFFALFVYIFAVSESEKGAKK